VCLNNIGNVYMQKGENQDALTYFQQSLQLREKLNVPDQIADTLHNIGLVYAGTGEYDKAMASHMRALELNRKSNDNRGAAAEQNAIGVLFQEQGRFGAAVTSGQDALKALRDADDHSRNLVDVLTNLARSLAKAGRGNEAPLLLDEARKLNGSLKNQALMAALLNAQGEVAYYQGDLKAANQNYQEALRVATQAKARNEILASKIALAKAALQEGRGKSVVGELASLSKQAGDSGASYLAVESSVDMAEAMIASKDYTRALSELDRALSKSEKFGLRAETARIHYLMASAQRLSGKATDAQGNYLQAQRLLEDLQKDQGAEKVLTRYDLRTIYEETKRWAKAA
jgi:tetratricopeptide (TPR) repeat protein